MFGTCVQTQPSIYNRFFLYNCNSYDAMMQFLDKYIPYQRELLSYIMTFSTSIENFKNWIIITYQTNGMSTNIIEAVVKLFRMNFNFIVRIRDVLSH